MIPAFIMLLTAATAMCMDLAAGKVGNQLILISAAAGLLWRLTCGGPKAAAEGLAGMLTAFIVLFILFVFRMLGAGDIKLFCALGTVLGPSGILRCIAFSLFFGAVIAIPLMIIRGIPIERLTYFITYIRGLAYSKDFRPYRCGGLERPENFHFTIPIFISAILMIVLKQVPAY